MYLRRREEAPFLNNNELELVIKLSEASDLRLSDKLSGLVKRSVELAEGIKIIHNCDAFAQCYMEFVSCNHVSIKK